MSPRRCGARRWSCPTTSANVFGRSLSASGRGAWDSKRLVCAMSAPERRRGQQLVAALDRHDPGRRRRGEKPLQLRDTVDRPLVDGDQHVAGLEPEPLGDAAVAQCSYDLAALRRISADLARYT